MALLTSPAFPSSVVNYPGGDVDFTRIVEYKHYFHQKSPYTVIVKEYR